MQQGRLPNYLRYWDLRAAPFRTTIDVRSFHAAGPHEEALARMHFVVEQGRAAGLLLGPSGGGKSLLLEVFAGQLRNRRAAVITLDLTGLWTEDFPLALADALGVESQSAAWRLWSAIVARIRESHYQQMPVVFLFDNVDRARTGVEDLLSRLSQLRRGELASPVFLFTASPDQILRTPHSLLRLIDLRIDLDPWDADDCAAFVESRLEAAGARDDRPIFTPEAVIRLHALSGGIPRELIRLADLALLAGAGEELPHLGAEVIDTVYEELYAPSLLWQGEADVDTTEWDIELSDITPD